MKIGKPRPWFEVRYESPEIEDLIAYRVHHTASLFGLRIEIVDGGLLVSRSESINESDLFDSDPSINELQ